MFKLFLYIYFNYEKLKLQINLIKADLIQILDQYVLLFLLN